MALKMGYYPLWFKSFRLKSSAGHRSDIQLSLVKPQVLPAEIRLECDSRPVDPFDLLTECNQEYFFNYPLGTKFLLKATLTDRNGGTPFFYSYYGWKPIKIVAATT